MKIAIYHNLPSGGAKRALYEYIKRTRVEKIDLYTLSSSCEKKYLPIEKYLCNSYVYNIKIKKGFLNFLKFVYIELPKIQRKIAKDINKRKYNLVFVNHDFFTKSPYLLRYLNLPTIYLCHEPPRIFYEDIQWHISSLKHLLVNIFLIPKMIIDILNVKKASLVITLSKYSKRVLSKIYKIKIERVKGGVDVRYFKNLGLKRSKKLLFVGSMSKLKGCEFIIKGLSKIPKVDRPELTIVVNGGKNIDYFQKLAFKNKVRLEVKKNISDKELIKIYNKAFLFLYFPYKEPFGLVALEAMACGLPVLGVNEGGVKETLGKENFIIKRNINIFANNLEKLIKNEKLVEKKRNKVRKYVEKYWNWNVGAHEMLNHFKTISSKNP